MASYELLSVKPTELLRHFSNRLPSVWKFFDLLPIFSEQSIVSLGEGGTFLHGSSRLATEIGLQNLMLKNETTNPTGSFVDRGTSVAISMAKECKDFGVYCWSKGNFGASLAAYSAKAGIGCTVFVPSRVDIGKLYQITAFGPTIRIANSWSDVRRDVAGARFRFRQITPSDPFYLEGIKTTGLEICEQLKWNPPGSLVVPVGDGSHLAMIWKGMKEIEQLGILDGRLPKMYGVQGETSGTMAESATSVQKKIREQEGMEGLASDIKVERPLLGTSANRAMKESGGSVVMVSDNAILEAAAQLARTEGIFAEPAGAATVAGLMRLMEEGLVEKDERVVSIITGGGLKDPASVRRFLFTSVQAKRILKRVERQKEFTAIGGTKLRILQLLESRELYGYALWRSLHNKHKVSLKLSSVYQHLDELEEGGLIVRSPQHVVEKGRVRHLYRLTTKGRGLLKLESKYFRESS
jgi:threonine synthase